MLYYETYVSLCVIDLDWVVDWPPKLFKGGVPLEHKNLEQDGSKTKKSLKGLQSLVSRKTGTAGTVTESVDRIIPDRNSEHAHDQSDKVDLNFVLIIQEYEMHPEPFIREIIDKFESLSIIRVHGKSGLDRIKTAPVYDERYLVLFETVRTFKDNIPLIKFDLMFPVLLCNNSSISESAEALCKQHKVPYKIFRHAFTKANAYVQIEEILGVRPPIVFCEHLIKTVGLNPMRIISALAALSGMEKSVANINKYVDKYIYVSGTDIIKCLLGMSKSKVHRKRTAEYLNRNRFWYVRYVKPSMVSEINNIIKVYSDILSGTLTPTSTMQYLEETGFPRRLVLFVEELYRKKTFPEVLEVKVFIERSRNALDIASQL